MAQSDVMCSLLTREAHITRRSRHHARSAHHVPLAEHIVPKTKKQSNGLLSLLVAEVGFEPHDLRVMSPTSYQAALLRDIRKIGAGNGNRTRTMLSHHGILSPGRLPIPPLRRISAWAFGLTPPYYIICFLFCQAFFEKRLNKYFSI